jgi:hypothetical protein
VIDEVVFSGPLDETVVEDVWVIGGVETARPILDLVEGLCRSAVDGPYAFRADVYVGASEQGFSPVVQPTLHGYVGSVAGDVPDFPTTPSCTVLARGEVVYDPFTGEYLVGTTRVFQEVTRALSAALAPFVGRPGAVEARVVAQIVPDTGYDDPPRVDRVVTVREAVRLAPDEPPMGAAGTVEGG